MNKPVVGFVGLGRIGRPMAERLLGAGFALVVHDIDERALTPFRGRAEVAGSVADIGARCDVVIGCLQTAEQYRSAVLGASGLREAARAKAYLHVGTTGRALVIELTDALASRGIATLDAPISGGVAGARSGTLVTMAAGPRALFDALEACLVSWSRRIVYLGSQPGLGQAMKLVNNMLSAANLAAAVEVLAVGAKAGLHVTTMLDVLNHGTGQNSATLTKVPGHIASRTFDAGSSLHNVEKDLSAYAGEARAAGIDSALCAAVLAAYVRAGREGSMDDDISTVARPFERLTGVELDAGAA